MSAVNRVRKNLSASEKERLKRRLRLLQKTLEAFPVGTAEKKRAIGDWVSIDAWAQSAMHTTSDIIFQLSPDRRRIPEVGMAFNRAMSAYDATAGIVDRKYAGLRREDFRLAKTAIRQCIESGNHLL